jgi:hypothetical protein
VFLEPEPDFWMVMSVELAILRRQTKDGKLITEHLDDELNDRALEAVLKLGYDQFKVSASQAVQGDNKCLSI